MNISQTKVMSFSLALMAHHLRKSAKSGKLTKY